MTDVRTKVVHKISTKTSIFAGLAEYDRIRNANVLVTGGAGFIGSNLCADLLKYGNRVVCLDNFATGHVTNIAELRDHKNFRLFEGDIRDLETCRNAVGGVDIVLHQAALGSVPRSIDDPVTTNSVNVTGFLNMLVASHEAGVKRFVYAASSSAYGDSSALPKVEDVIGKPLSPYAVTKYAGELYAHVFAMHYGLEVIGLRYFNVFGRRQDPAGAYAAAIPKFIMLLMKHTSPVIYGDGETTRDFTYIDNVIQMNHLAATTTNKAAIGQVFNTAGGQSASLNELLKLLKTFIGQIDPTVADVKVKYEAQRKGDIRHSLASIDKARDLLGYAPTHTFAEGLRETVNWYIAAQR